MADRARERYAAALISSEMYDDARNELLRISKHDICDLCPTDEAWQKLYKHFLDAEKFDAAEDAASHAANWERRGLLHEIQLRRRTGMMEESIDHKNYDANSIDTLVAFSKPGRERDKEVLRPIVFALLHAGDSRRARQYAHQVSEVGGRAELLLSIALSEIKDGDRTNAIVDAREVLRLRHDTPIADWPTYGGDGLVAVASAIVGDYAFAFKYPVGDASQFQYYVGDPSFIGFFEPYLEDYGVDDDVVFGRIAFIQAMAGKVGDALKTAKMADTRIKDPEHFPYAEIGYAQLLQGRLSNALDTAVRMPAADSARSRVMKSNLIGRIMYEQIKTGDLKGAEKTISLFIPPIEWKNLWHIGVRYQIDGYIALAEAYRIRKNMPEVSRYLAAAQKMILNARLDDRLQSQSHNPVFDLLGRVADAQAAAGDAEATQTLRALIPSPYLQSWLDMAVSLSTDKLATDLTSQLQAWTENATYSDSVIGAITQLALEIDTRLLKMRALEQGATNVK